MDKKGKKKKKEPIETFEGQRKVEFSIRGEERREFHNWISTMGIPRKEE